MRKIREREGKSWGKFYRARGIGLPEVKTLRTKWLRSSLLQMAEERRSWSSLSHRRRLPGSLCSTFSTTPLLFNHRRWRRSSGCIALGFIKKLIFSLFHFLGLSDFLELTFRGPKRRRKCWNTSRYRQFWSVKSCRWWSSGRRFAEATRRMSVRLRGRRRDQAVDQL